MRTYADYVYARLLENIVDSGDIIQTRNSITRSHWNLPNVTFASFPLVTWRNTALKKAIQEMEWFISGTAKCPEVLLDWWDGQLSASGCLLTGYSEQFRASTYAIDGVIQYFDQVKFVLEGLRSNPNSRRLLISMWNPADMANIATINGNPNTPTCCHSIVIQFFVRSGALYMRTYQRSADMLLGVPHNWVQSWALLTYFAHHADLEVGGITWMWGDAHIYQEQSHMDAVNTIINHSAKWFEDNTTAHSLKLEYNPTGAIVKGIPEFKASDFSFSYENKLPPIVTHKVKLL